MLGIFLILVAWYLWKTGDSKQSFWEVLTDLLGDIIFYEGIAPFSYRAWAVLLWLIGFVILIIVILAKINS